MRINGRRRCRDCGETWAYYDTGEITCPACGSIRSVGTDPERRLHTDANVDLDLSAAREALDTKPTRAVAERAETAAFEYLNERGFVHAGALQSLDDTIIAASQLRYVSARIARSMSPPDDAVESHFLALLDGAPSGSRPDSVPDALRAAHGLAIADVVDRYRSEIATWLGSLDDPPNDVPLEHLRDEQRRIEALDGDVAPSRAETLLETTRTLGEALRSGDESALAAVSETFEAVQ